MTTQTVRIDPDGKITELAEDGHEAASIAFGSSVTVVTCAAPMLPPGVFVGWIDDFGAQDLPLNMKAWALYGRSSIFGPMILGMDSGGPVPAHVIDMLNEPIEAWVPAETVAYMREHEHDPRPRMMAPRPTKEKKQ